MKASSEMEIQIDQDVLKQTLSDTDMAKSMNDPLRRIERDAQIKFQIDPQTLNNIIQSTRVRQEYIATKNQTDHSALNSLFDMYIKIKSLKDALVTEIEKVDKSHGEQETLRKAYQFLNDFPAQLSSLLSTLPPDRVLFDDYFNKNNILKYLTREYAIAESENRFASFNSGQAGMLSRIFDRLPELSDVLDDTFYRIEQLESGKENHLKERVLTAAKNSGLFNEALTGLSSEAKAFFRDKITNIDDAQIEQNVARELLVSIMAYYVQLLTCKASQSQEWVRLLTERCNRIYKDKSLQEFVENLSTQSDQYKSTITPSSEQEKQKLIDALSRLKAVLVADLAVPPNQNAVYKRIESNSNRVEALIYHLQAGRAIDLALLHEPFLQSTLDKLDIAISDTIDGLNQYKSDLDAMKQSGSSAYQDLEQRIDALKQVQNRLAQVVLDIPTQSMNLTIKHSIEILNEIEQSVSTKQTTSEGIFDRLINIIHYVRDFIMSFFDPVTNTLTSLKDSTNDLNNTMHKMTQALNSMRTPTTESPIIVTSDKLSIAKDGAQALADWNRLAVGSVYINGVTLEELVRVDRGLAELPASEKMFETTEQLSAFLSKYLLKNLPTNTVDDVLRKRTALDYTMRIMHQGGLIAPITAEANVHISGNTDYGLMTATSSGPKTQTRELNLLITATGFNVQEISTQYRMIHVRGDLEMQFIDPDPGSDYVYKAQGTFNVDFSQDPSNPTLKTLSNTIDFGNKMIEDKLSEKPNRLSPPMGSRNAREIMNEWRANTIMKSKADEESQKDKRDDDVKPGNRE